MYQGGNYGGLDTQTITGITPLARTSIGSQRTAGTVYGGATGLPTTANAEAPLEHSGSLTGLILAQGHPGSVSAAQQRSSLTKVLVVGGVGLLFALVVGLVVAALAGDFIRSLVGALTGA